MVSLDDAVIARLKKGEEHFEVLVDPYAAADLIDGKDIDVIQSLAIESVFKDSKKGTHASEESLQKNFGTGDITEITKQIILKGDIQLTTDDIDLDNRIVYIDHNPKNGQSTKTKISRISFFNKETQKALNEYLTYFESDGQLKQLFSQNHITRLFRNAPIQVKDLRKYFSQEWDRHGGPTSIKKILMGHSLKGDVDLMHYNYQSEEDLKKIYDKIMA